MKLVEDELIELFFFFIYEKYRNIWNIILFLMHHDEALWNFLCICSKNMLTPFRHIVGRKQKFYNKQFHLTIVKFFEIILTMEILFEFENYVCYWKFNYYWCENFKVYAFHREKWERLFNQKSTKLMEKHPFLCSFL